MERRRRINLGYRDKPEPRNECHVRFAREERLALGVRLEVRRGLQCLVRPRLDRLRVPEDLGPSVRGHGAGQPE